VLADILDDAAPAIVISEGDVPPGNWRVLSPAQLDAAEPLGIAAVHPEDPAYIVYSSGSTGRPKGAVHAHRDMQASVEGYAAHVLALGPGDASLLSCFGPGFELQHQVLGPAARSASGMQATARLGLEQRKVIAVDGEFQVVLAADAPVDVDAAATQLQAHIREQPVGTVQRGLGMAAGVLPAHLAAEIVDLAVQRGVLAETFAARGDPEGQLSAHAGPRPLDVEAAHVAGELPAFLWRPLRFTGELGLAIPGLHLRVLQCDPVARQQARAGEGHLRQILDPQPAAGDLVIVLEAMKMEQPLTAHKDGVIALINAEIGATVSSGTILLEITD
jgi:hypothetical protein